jgi:ubiquinone/menaquinone biosynthesis C-methylase UbiE
VVLSEFDAVAGSFDRYRALPEGVPQAIRTAILHCVHSSRQPRLLDLGAGTGRIGYAFAAAGDDYVGVDLSRGMLLEFVRKAGEGRGRAPNLVQADGARLPFRNATFDAVMLIQIFGGIRGWRHIVAEARRVMCRGAVLLTGRLIMPEDGIDQQMKQRLDLLLDAQSVRPQLRNTRSEAHHCLESAAEGSSRITAAVWRTKRTPRGFLDRHQTGARFSTLPSSMRKDVLESLRVWVEKTFGSLDSTFEEQHQFELRAFKFNDDRRRMTC